MEKRFTFTQKLIDDYGKLNGDNDIIHYDIDYARQRGFKDTLAHGPHVAGIAAEMAARKFGAAWHRGGSIDVKFVGPTFPNEEIVIRIEDDGKVTAQSPSGLNFVGQITVAG